MIPSRRPTAWRHSFWALTLPALVMAGWCASAHARPEGAKRALLIGIQDYPAPIPTLHGIDKDLDKMQDALESRGFQTANIKRLWNQEASKAAIEKAITDLAQQCGPEDAAVIYYSGHGSQVPDLTGTDDTGWDQAIVPFEQVPAVLNTEADVNRLLIDKRIAVLLKQFKTPNLTVIFDSCHSGTAIRDAKEAPPAELSVTKFADFEVGPELHKKAEDARAAKGGKQDAPVAHDYVYLAACQDWETSGCNGRGSFFTNVLASSLKVMNNSSWSGIYPVARQVLCKISASQTCRFEGKLNRKPFSMDEVPGDAPFFRPSITVVGAVPINPKVVNDEIQDGALTGSAGKSRAVLASQPAIIIEQAGALYDVYPSDTTDFSAAPKGRVQLTSDLVTAIIKDGSKPVDKVEGPVAEIRSGEVAAGDRLVAVSVPIPAMRPKVGVLIGRAQSDSDKSKAQSAAQDLLRRLASAAGIERKEGVSLDQLDYAVMPKVASGEMSVYVWSSTGLRLATFSGGNPDSLYSKAIDFIRARHQMLTRLVRINNPSPDFSLTAEVPGDEKEWAAGEKINLVVTTGRAAWITALVSFSETEPSHVIRFRDQLEAKKPAIMEITVPKGVDGKKLAVKVFATPERVPEAAFQSNLGVVDCMINALRTQVSNGGGAATYLGTKGWADATAWLSTKK